MDARGGENRFITEALIVSVGEKPALVGAAAARASARPRVATGVVHVVDARGCDPEALRPRLQALFARLLGELALEMVAASVWHVFPGHGALPASCCSPSRM